MSKHNTKNGEKEREREKEGKLTKRFWEGGREAKKEKKKGNLKYLKMSTNFHTIFLSADAQ
ncbi:hypothetical protein Bpfe_012775, partial [Biomphalaria pfeifferi]